LASLPDRSRTIALTACAAPLGRKWTAAPEDAAPLVARDFLRFGLDRTWRRHSYTSLAHGSKAATLSALEDEGVDRDADEERPPAEAATDRLAALPSYEVPADAPSVPLGDFQAGADAGTFLHALFEKADFQWAHPEQGGEKGSAELRRLIETELPAHGFDAERWAELIHQGMLQVLRTPLGGELALTRLCDIPASARLNEFRFDFPLAGGSAFGQEPHKLRVRSEAIVQALRLRKAPSPGESDEATIRTAYLAGLERFGNLAGFMTGSMDLVFRHVVDGRPKWFLVDYKSNRLDPGRLGRWPIHGFCREGMRYAMEQSHYYLQYHIYLVALHRYLGLRLRGDYSYAENLGGVYYLFFRGMIGPDTPSEDGRRHGCFYDKPPLEVIVALDRLFADPAAAPSGGAR
jgi:exodeoxyribonuclease V beta subunit